MNAVVTAGDTRVHTVSDEAGWQALAPAWDRLLSRTDGATALQSYAFLRSWWRHMARGKTPWIVVATRGGEVAGVAPLQLARRRIWGVSYRVLELMGMPDELDRPTWLTAPRDREVLEALLAGIAAERRAWDLMQLDELESASWVVPVLRQWARRQRLWCRVEPFHPCPYLEKNGATWEAYLKRRSKRFAKRLREARRKLEKEGELTYERAASGPDAVRLVESFFEVEARSWKAAAGLAAGADENYRAFCRTLMGGAAAPCEGHVIVQRVAGRPSAATLGVSLDGVYYSLQIAHDAAFVHCSPGTVLEAFEMQWFFEQTALQRYEFLGGDVSNKRRWAEASIETSRVFVRQPGLHIAVKDLSRFHVRPALDRLATRLTRQGKRRDAMGNATEARR